jgi:hypothetical protein
MTTVLPNYYVSCATPDVTGQFGAVIASTSRENVTDNNYIVYPDRYDAEKHFQCFCGDEILIVQSTVSSS